MNKGVLGGFISSDIKGENITLKSGEQMRKVSFSIACRRTKDVSDFPWVECFGKRAEAIEQWMSKGKGIIVYYHIQTGKYTNKDGKTVFSTTNVVDDWEFPPVRKDEEQSQGGDTYTNDTQQNTQSPPPQKEDDFMNVPDDILGSLPFK
jgi:single-strand DNA-binding protein